MKNPLGSVIPQELLHHLDKLDKLDKFDTMAADISAMRASVAELVTETRLLNANLSLLLLTRAA